MASKETIAKFGIEVTGADKLDKADAEGDDLETTLHSLVEALRELTSVAKGLNVAPQIEKADEAAEKATGSTEGWGNALVAAGKALAAYFAVDALAGMTQDVIDHGNEISNMAARVGVSTDAWQRWATVGKMVGVQAEDLGGAMKGLAKNAQEAQKAGSTQAKIFDELGVSTLDASGNVKDAGTLMKETGLALGSLSDEGKATQLTMQLMEDAGLKLLPAFKKGGKALEEMLATVDEFGLVTPETIEQMQLAREAQVKWDLASMSLKTAFVSAFLPALTKAITWAAKFAGALKGLAGVSSVAKAAVWTLGSVLGAIAIAAIAKNWVLLAQYGAMVAGFVLLAVVAEDFFATFEGKDTLLRRLFEQNGNMTAFGTAMHDLVFDAEAFFEKMGSGEGRLSILKTTLADLTLGLQGVNDKIAEALGVPPTWGEWGEALKGLNQKVTDAKKSFEDGLDAWRDETKAKAAAIGTAIVDGIVEGINASIDKVKGAIDALKDATIGQLGRAVEAHSPSKLAFEIGKGGIGAGLQLGIEASREGVMHASSNLGAASLGGTAAGAQSGGRGGNQITHNYTIYANGAAGQGLGQEIAGSLAPSTADADRRTLAALELG